MENIIDRLINAYKRLSLINASEEHKREISMYRRKLREMIYLLAE